MTLYSSRRAADLLPDVQTECRVHGDECYGCVYEREFWYDRVQNNPTNPILVAFREQNRPAHEARTWIDAVHRNPFDGKRRSQIDHARRVLARLANLSTEMENKS